MLHMDPNLFLYNDQLIIQLVKSIVGRKGMLLLVSLTEAPTGNTIHNILKGLAGSRKSFDDRLTVEKAVHHSFEPYGIR